MTIESFAYKIKTYRVLYTRVSHYKKWQLRFCNWFKIVPAYRHTMSVVFELNGANAIQRGDIIRFSNGFNARIEALNNNCYRTSVILDNVYHPDYIQFDEVYILQRTYSELNDSNRKLNA